MSISFQNIVSVCQLAPKHTMQYINPDVGTICTSIAASMSAVLLSSGAKGKRTCLYNTAG